MPADTARRRITKILIVDDDADAAWTLKHLLQQELGCDVRVAGDGAHAVDEASDMRPDVVIMDIFMPGIGGIEAAALLQRVLARSGVPRLIAVSGVDGGNAQALLDGGFDAFLPKPLDFDLLLRVLRR